MENESKEEYRVAVYGADDISAVLNMINATNANIALFRINDPRVLGEINEDDFDLIIVDEKKNEITNVANNSELFVPMNLDDRPLSEEELNNSSKKIMGSIYANKQKRYKKEIKAKFGELENKVMNLDITDDEKIQILLNEYLRLMRQKCITTYTHIINVKKYIDIYIEGIPEERKPNQKQIMFLERAALLHDVGKIFVLTSILTKKGKLTSEEYEAIKDHVSPDSFLFESKLMQQFKSSALCHHLRYDGGARSYPSELTFLVGDEIPHYSRIISVIDAFEAMTGNREYKAHRSLEEVIAILESEKGKQFDPEVVDTFVRGLRIHNGLDEALYTAKPLSR